MQRKLLIIAGVLIVAVAIFSLNSSNRESTPKQVSVQSEPKSKQESMQSAPQTSQVEAGKYVAYDEQVLSQTGGTRLLFFYAPWCPQCRALEADIKANSIPSGTTIFKVDYDTNQTLRQKYGVTIQTTVVRIDNDGNLVKKYVAYSEPTLDNVLKTLE